jgi:hypothetical protein
MGVIIGRGEFGFVRNVRQISDTFGSFGDSIMSAKPLLEEKNPVAIKEALKRFIRKGQSQNMDEFPSGDVCDLRTYMSERCHRGDTPRFAVKRIRNDLPPELTAMAIVDLAVEAKFLACIDHSNIVRLRATVGSPGSEDFLIVLDRLYCILDQRVKEWRDEEKSCRGLLNLRIVDKENHQRLTTERLMAMFDIARAVKHLHKHRYVLARFFEASNVLGLF